MIHKRIQSTYDKAIPLKGNSLEQEQTWVSRASSVGSLRSSLVFPFSVKRLTYKTSKTSVSLHQMKNRQLQESSLDPFHMSISTLVESSLQRSIASSLNVNVSTGPEILWGSKGIHQCKHSSQTSLLCKCTHVKLLFDHYCYLILKCLSTYKAIFRDINELVVSTVHMRNLKSRT